MLLDIFSALKMLLNGCNLQTLVDFQSQMCKHIRIVETVDVKSVPHIQLKSSFSEYSNNVSTNLTLNVWEKFTGAEKFLFLNEMWCIWYNHRQSLCAFMYFISVRVCFFVTIVLKLFFRYVSCMFNIAIYKKEENWKIRGSSFFVGIFEIYVLFVYVNMPFHIVRYFPIFFHFKWKILALLGVLEAKNMLIIKWKLNLYDENLMGQNT